MALTEMVIMPGEDYQAICDSVRAKTGGTELLKSGEVAPAIDGIEINTGTDTSDGTAEENDIAYGKIAYVNGERIEGNIPVESYIDTNAEIWWDSNNQRFNLYSSPVERVIVGSEHKEEADGEEYYYTDIVDLYCPGEELGNATVGDVAQGKTFTSENGVKLTGTYKNSIPIFQAYKTGTYSPSEDTSCGSGVYHGLGIKPNFYCIYCKESDALGSGYLNFAMGIQITGSGQAIYHYIDSQNWQVAATSTFFASTTYFNLQSGSVNYKGGYTYNWIIGVI